ncbi:kinase A anchor protein [Xylaria nigripes]|nr:kinase A anchor protein [Xylaria nigripes]
MPPRPSPTHFLCIPLTSSVAGRRQLAASLAAFRADVVSPDSFGVPDQAIRPVGTLHLTLGVMSLRQNESLEKAVSLLRTFKPRQILTDLNPAAGAALLSVSLRGLHSMQSAAKASVLYAPPVDADGVLTRFCETLRTVFRDAGFMTEDARPLLLHATVLNTIYVKGRGARRGEKITVDARGILDRYDDFLWMENVVVDKIAICKMGAKKLDDGDEAYEVEAEIDLV